MLILLTIIVENTDFTRDTYPANMSKKERRRLGFTTIPAFPLNTTMQSGNNYTR